MEPFREMTSQEQSQEKEAGEPIKFAKDGSDEASRTTEARGRGDLKYDDPASFALEVRADAGDEALLFCDRCHGALDLEGRYSRWAYDAETEQYGLKCDMHQDCPHLFCNGAMP